MPVAQPVVSVYDQFMRDEASGSARVYESPSSYRTGAGYQKEAALILNRALAANKSRREKPASEDSSS